MDTTEISEWNDNYALKGDFRVLGLSISEFQHTGYSVIVTYKTKSSEEPIFTNKTLPYKVMDVKHSKPFDSHRWMVTYKFDN